MTTLTKVLTIPQVAKLAGWQPNRMRAHLTEANKKLGGTLLVNVSHGKQRPRWTVTLSALQQIAPQWFQDPDNLQKQIEDLKATNAELLARIVRLEKMLAVHTTWLSDLGAQTAKKGKKEQRLVFDRR